MTFLNDFEITLGRYFDIGRIADQVLAETDPQTWVEYLDPNDEGGATEIHTRFDDESDADRAARLAIRAAAQFWDTHMPLIKPRLSRLDLERNLELFEEVKASKGFVAGAGYVRPDHVRICGSDALLSMMYGLEAWGRDKGLPEAMEEPSAA